MSACGYVTKRTGGWWLGGAGGIVNAWGPRQKVCHLAAQMGPMCRQPAAVALAALVGRQGDGSGKEEEAPPARLQ